MEVETKLEAGQHEAHGQVAVVDNNQDTGVDRQPRHWGGHFRSGLQPRSWGGDLRGQPQDNLQPSYWGGETVNYLGWTRSSGGQGVQNTFC